MRKLAAIIVALNLFAVLGGSPITAATGLSGAHVHYDHTWHSPAAPEHHDIDHGNLQDADGLDGAPHEHSDADHVHLAYFLVPGAASILKPAPAPSRNPAPEPFLTNRQPHPPFRPPQVL